MSLKRMHIFPFPARLVGSEDHLEGRLEVHRYPDGWGTVCDDAFENVDAQVACQMMGLEGGVVVSNTFGEGTGSIFLDNVECNGNEPNLWDCNRNEWGDHNCGHNEDVAIRCGKSWCSSEWASYQIRKIADCACTGNAGNVYPPSTSKETAS